MLKKQIKNFWFWWWRFSDRRSTEKDKNEKINIRGTAKRKKADCGESEKPWGNIQHFTEQTIKDRWFHRK